MLGDGELRKGNLPWIWGNFGYEGRGLSVSLGEGCIVRGTGSDEKGIYRGFGGDFGEGL